MIQELIVERQLSTVFLSKISRFLAMGILPWKFVEFQPVYAIGRYEGSKQER